MDSILTDTLIRDELVKIQALLDRIADPEIPVLSITDLGIVRDINIFISDTVPSGPDKPFQGTIRITPTYSGCPAMDMIKNHIMMTLQQNGYARIQVELVLAPAWTTDWMSDSAKDKLKSYGIAPPQPRQQTCQSLHFQEEESVACPRCNSAHTRQVSRFGSTPCKALYKCLDCQEPFDYFKCH